MIENISKEQARHMVELLKKKSVLIKNFSHKLEKYRISGDREMYDKNVCRQMNLNFSGQKIKECLANLV